MSALNEALSLSHTKNRWRSGNMDDVAYHKLEGRWAGILV